MASNKELAKEALALGKELGAEVEVDGLNNAKLEALVAELRAKKAAASPVSGGAVRKADVEGESSSDSSSAEKAPPAPPPAPKGSRVVVAAGRSVTSKRGILGPGTEVRAAYFADGEEAIKRLLKAGLFRRT